MIRVQLIGGDKVVAMLNKVHPAVMASVARGLTILGFKLQRHVMQDKLMGQVLGKYTSWRATNRLRNSINVSPVQMTATGGRVSVGTNVVYAAIHEYGGKTKPHLILPRRAQALAFTMAGQLRFFRKVNHPGSTMPERSFLRSALADMKGEITATLSHAISEGLKK